MVEKMHRICYNKQRGNLFPEAYAYPKQMGPTRDLLRRRCYYVVLRAAANTHIQTPFAQNAILDVGGAPMLSAKIPVAHSSIPNSN